MDGYDEFGYEEISPFCIGFSIFGFLLACFAAVTIYRYKTFSNSMLIITLVLSNACYAIIAIVKSFSAAVNKLIQALPSHLLHLGLCFIFGIAFAIFVIRRYWTGKSKG